MYLKFYKGLRLHDFRGTNLVDFPTGMKKPLDLQGVVCFKADRTGLEPATSAVTGRRSNQLNYRSISV